MGRGTPVQPSISLCTLSGTGRPPVRMMPAMSGYDEETREARLPRMTSARSPGVTIMHPGVMYSRKFPTCMAAIR